MGQLAELRDQLQQERFGRLSTSVAPLLAGRVGTEVWLFGSWARGDWDARTDLDLITVDLIAVETSEWQARRSLGDPHWRAISREAILIAAGSKP
ncbi:nucleotidyltransferase domain-containing protein [Cyanobium sp. ATX 6F1]|uniref:nucleotidyltransferase domain-containing protein n=1 Tax=unclassified Cyanobium TaxID=2627006 RepID=UPI0020CC57C1|nr:nucleotidyltransferase domain-containing protein [Cyanobium sp. ATX 6F1]MCP9915139.1 nucleotidyltransferase domain-containing protein [Cyanobium sp. ATX 6F1]